jgi:hypothetical protein
MDVARSTALMCWVCQQDNYQAEGAEEAGDDLYSYRPQQTAAKAASDGRDSWIAGQIVDHVAVAMIAVVELVKFPREFGAGDQT